jgi:hypothetical protein
MNQCGGRVRARPLRSSQCPLERRKIRKPIVESGLLAWLIALVIMSAAMGFVLCAFISTTS